MPASFNVEDLYNEETPGEQDEDEMLDAMAFDFSESVPEQEEPAPEPEPIPEPEQPVTEDVPERDITEGGVEPDLDEHDEDYYLDLLSVNPSELGDENLTKYERWAIKEAEDREDNRPSTLAEKARNAVMRGGADLASGLAATMDEVGPSIADLSLETQRAIGLMDRETYDEIRSSKENLEKYREFFSKEANNPEGLGRALEGVTRLIGVAAFTEKEREARGMGDVAHYFNERAEEFPESLKAAKLQDAGFLETVTTPEFYIERLAPEAAKLGVAVAAGWFTGNPYVPIGVISGSVFGKKKQHARELLTEKYPDMTEGEIESLATASGGQAAATEAILEMLPIGKALGLAKGGKSLATKTAFANRMSDFLMNTRVGRKVSLAVARGEDIVKTLGGDAAARAAGTARRAVTGVGAAEAFEEVASGNLERLTDYLLLGEHTSLEEYLRQSAIEAVGGAAIGAPLGVPASFAQSAPQHRQRRVSAMVQNARKMSRTPEGMESLKQLSGLEAPSRKDFIDAGFHKDAIGNASERADLAEYYTDEAIQKQQDVIDAVNKNVIREGREGKQVQQPQVLAQPVTDAPGIKQIKDQAGQVTKQSKQLAGPKLVRKMQTERRELAKNIAETYNLKPMMADSVAEVVQSTLTPEEVSLISFERGGKPGESALFQIAEVVERIQSDTKTKPTGSEDLFFGKILPKHWDQTKKELKETSGVSLTKAARAQYEAGELKGHGRDFEKHYNTRGTKKILERAVDDYSKFIKDNPEYEQYYETETVKEREQLVQQYPELSEDTNFHFYRMINGIASAQTELGKNTEETVAAYGGFRQTGRIPVVIGTRKGKVLKSGVRQVKDAPVYAIPANKRPITGTEAADAATAHEFDTAIKSDVDNVVNVMRELDSIIPEEVLAILSNEDAEIPAGLKILTPGKDKGKPVKTQKQYLYDWAAPTYITSDIAKRANTTSRPLVMKMYIEWKGYDAGTRESDFRGRVRTAFEIGGGSSQYNKARNYKVLNTLLSQDQFKTENGTPDLPALIAWLNERVSWDQLKAERKDLGFGLLGNKADIEDTVFTAEGQQEMIPRTFIFGPKVGAYMLNRMADYNSKNADYNTMDVWESRFWRGFNNDLNDTEKGIADGVPRKVYMRQARDFVKEYEKQTGKPLKVSAGQAGRWYLMKSAMAEAGYLKAGRDETIAGFTGELVDRFARQQLNALQPETPDLDASLIREFGDEGDIREAFDVDVEEAGFQARTEAIGSQEGQTGIVRLLFQTSGKEIRGAMEKLPGGRILLHGLTNPTVDTAIEEIAHGIRTLVFNPDIPAAQRGTTDEQLSMVHKWAHETSDHTPAELNEWTRAAEERFAEAFRDYMSDGIAPVARLKTAFNRIGAALTRLYRKMRGAPNIEITPEIRSIFDNLMTRREQQIEEGAVDIENDFAKSIDTDSLVKKGKKDGGFTYDTNKNEYVTKGWAFAPRKDTEHKIPVDTVTASDLDAYIEKYADELAKPENKLGSWIEDGYLWLDVAQVGTFEEASEAGAKADQEAIFDLETFTYKYLDKDTGEYVSKADPDTQPDSPISQMKVVDETGIPSEFVDNVGNVKLHRFSQSDRGETFEIDPSKTKPRTISRNDYNMASTPRTFHYLDPTQRERGIIGKHQYVSEISSDQIYNLIKDPSGFKAKHKQGNSYDFDAIFKDIIDSGKSGVYYKPAGLHIVNMFKPIKGTRYVDQVQKAADDRPEGAPQPTPEPTPADEPAAIRRGVGRRGAVRVAPAAEGQAPPEAIERAPLPSEGRKADTERSAISLATEPIGRGESAWSRNKKGDLKAKPISKREAVRNILDRIGLTAAENFKGIAPNAAGYYKKARLGLGQGGVGLAIRRRELADIGVAVHEAVHYYDDLLGVTDLNRPITKSAAKNLNHAEMAALANESYQEQGKRTLKEGFAEAVRLMTMAENPRSVFRSQLAFDAANKLIESQGNEQLKKFIEDSRGDVEQYMAQTDAEKISRAMMSGRGTVVDPGESYFARHNRGRYGANAVMRHFERWAIDNRRDASHTVREVESRFKRFWDAHKPDPSKTADKAWAEVVQATDGKFDQMLLQHSNFTRQRTEELVIGTDKNPGAIDIFKDFSQKEIDDFCRYMYSVVSLQRMQNDPSYQPGEADGSTLEDFVADHKSDKFDDATKQVTDYFNGLLEQMKEAGLITDIDLDRMTKAHELFMPFYRQFADENYASYGGQFVNVKPPLKKLKGGSVMPVLDVYDAMMTRTNEVVGAINRKKIEDSMIDLFQNSGVADEFLRVTNGPGPGVIRRVKDGVEEFYQIDQDLRDAMGRLGNPVANNLFLKFFNKIARVPRNLMVNWNPLFATRNYPRDFKTAQIKGILDTTGFEEGSYTADLITGSVKELFAGAGRDPSPVEQLYAERGGRLDRKMESVMADKDLLGRKRRRKIGQQEETIIDHMKKAGKAAVALNEITELAPRMAAFKVTLQQLGKASKGKFSVDKSGNIKGEIPEWAITQAMSNAQEITVNFNRRGLAAPYIEPLTLYFNASMQGSWYSRGQVMGDPDARKRLVIWTSLAATAHVLGLAAMAIMPSPDDEEKSMLDHYWEIPDYYRKSQSVFMVNVMGEKVAVAIPREREWGSIQRVIEETARAAFGPEEFQPTDMVWQELKDTMGESVAATGGILPTLGQLYVNHNIHYGEDIESEWDKDKHITQRYDSRTMSGSKFLSQNLLHHDIFFEGMSPKETDFVLRNAGLGSFAAWADALWLRPGDKAPYMVDEKPRQSINDFYVKMQEITQDAQGIANGVKIKNENKVLEDQAAFALASSVMKKLREAEDISDEDKQKYLTGIARWALGREEDSLYPNPLTSKDLPPKVKAAINKAMARKRKEAKGEAKNRFRKSGPK